MTSSQTNASDPKPSIDRIDELARRILEADILLPKFQREFVWDRSQIINLLDSISKGYPIGSILLWCSREKLRSERNIAELEIRAHKDEYPTNYLLDGQQRLSTICGALYWRGSEAKSRWNIAYDLKAKSFLHLDHMDETPPHLLRINKISEPSAFYKHYYALDGSSYHEKELLKKNADELFSRFKDYKIACVTLGDIPLKDVAPIFERINSQGTALTIVDLMRAATWSEDFDLVDSIDGIMNVLNEKDFNDFDRKTVLRNISASLGKGFSAEGIDSIRDFSSSSLQKAVADTAEAYRKAVDFLQNQILIQKSNSLPYLNQLTVLVEIFRQLSVPDASQSAAIQRWFWKSCLSGYFQGWNTGSMARDLSSIHEFSQRNRIEIEFPFEDPGSTIWKDRTFRANTAISKLFSLILCQKKPRDILTGQVVSHSGVLAQVNEKEFHHFFPKKYLDDIGVNKVKINALANFIVITSDSNKKISKTKPSEYLRWVSNAAGDNLSGAALLPAEVHAAFLAA